MEGRMALEKKPSHSWWFDSHTGSRSSPWLIKTLAESEEKTKAMLKLIEEDADSFAKRAEMYYKKRPELMSMIEDFYRAHRSLAERYDQLRLEGVLRHTASFDSPSSTKSWLWKVRNAVDKLSEPSLDSFESEESEVDDPEPEAQVEGSSSEAANEKSGGDAAKQVREEMERLKEENATLKNELAAKDEEKREVIRQLSVTVDILKEENHRLRRCIKDSRKWGVFEFKKLKMGVLSAKLFGGAFKF